MNVNIRFPSINGATEREQIAQIRSYLHQLVQQLNWAFSTVEGEKTAVSGGITAEDRASIIKEVAKMISEAIAAAQTTETETAAEENTETDQTGGDTNG